MNFLERTLAGFLSAMEHALDAEDLAKANGLLQRLDPRIKVLGILILIIAAATAHKLWVIGAVFAIALVLAASSRVSPLLWPSASGSPFCSSPASLPCPRLS